MNTDSRKPAGRSNPKGGAGRSDWSRRWLLLVLLFFSGASALVYQVVWTRMLVATFGATVYAMGAVVTAFMAGLALGSFLFGRYVDRGRMSPLVLYGVLELVIGLFAVFFPTILQGVTAVHVVAFQKFSASFFTFTLLRFALCTMALILPTTLMGATLPVVVKFAVRKLPRLGSAVGSLYAVNTFGAVVGTFAAGFFLIELLGMRTTSIIAALINTVVGLIAIAVGMRIAAIEPATVEGERVAAPASAPASVQGSSKGSGSQRSESEVGAAEKAVQVPGAALPGEARLILLGAGVAGLAALSNEVLWTRIMVYVLGNFVHSFSLVLMSFLFGITLGSAIISRYLDRPGVGLRLFGLFQFSIGIVVLILIPLFAPLIGFRESFLRSLSGVGTSLDTPDPWWQFTMWKMGAAFVILLVPTFLMGASFPLAAKIYSRAMARVGRGVGDVYGINTLGAIAGSFLASFILVEALGVRISAISTGSVSVAVGIVILWFAPVPSPDGAAGTVRSKPKRKGHGKRGGKAVRAGKTARSVEGRDLGATLKLGSLIAGTASVLIAFALIPREVFVDMYATAEKRMALIYVNESASGTVTVHQAQSGHRVLDINGLNVAGTKFGFLVTQKMQAHFPLLSHPDPKKVMQIGFGSGGTCWSISLHPSIERIDCVEISPSVIRAATLYFQDMNQNVLSDPRVSLVIEDARNFVMATDERYDIILSDSIHPRYVGNGSLYTKEYFELCKSRLTEDGILSFWLPTYFLSDEEYKMIVRTLEAAFPHVIIWYMNNTVEAYSVAMGSMKPIRLDLERVRLALENEGLNADLASVRMNDPLAIADCLAVHGSGIEDMVGEGLLNTEDRPLVEFRAPRNMIRERGEWMNLSEIARARRFPEGLVVNLGASPEEQAATRESLERYYRATTHVMAGHLFHITGRLREELGEYEKALAINPDDADAPYLAERVMKLVRREPLD
ncbi:MAG: fused MFS/spermidine synthase [Candidatus Eiseniibacteriota bacterium]|nr:MAG: fused MFS/spermidine synthase [Candidatus Eisenbacteria bacterium]